MNAMDSSASSTIQIVYIFPNRKAKQSVLFWHWLIRWLIPSSSAWCSCCSHAVKINVIWSRILIHGLDVVRLVSRFSCNLHRPVNHHRPSFNHNWSNFTSQFQFFNLNYNPWCWLDPPMPPRRHQFSGEHFNRVKLRLRNK